MPPSYELLRCFSSWGFRIVRVWHRAAVQIQVFKLAVRIQVLSFLAFDRILAFKDQAVQIRVFAAPGEKVHAAVGSQASVRKGFSAEGRPMAYRIAAGPSVVCVTEQLCWAGRKAKAVFEQAVCPWIFEHVREGRDSLPPVVCQSSVGVTAFVAARNRVFRRIHAAHLRSTARWQPQAGLPGPPRIVKLR